jgi:hypothetical protein
MANRYMTQFQLTLEKKVSTVFAHVTFGASGAPTLDAANSKGVVSVTRSSAGKYVFVFGTKAGMLDTYNKLLGVDPVFDTIGTSGAAPAAPNMAVVANSVAVAGTCSLTIQFFNSAGTATDPASGEGLYIAFTFKDSTAI